MTFGEAVELVGVMLGLLVFPAIPLAALFGVGLYYLISWRTLSYRRRKRLAWRFIAGCFVLGFVAVALMGCASHPTHGGWTTLDLSAPAPWIT